MGRGVEDRTLSVRTSNYNDQTRPESIVFRFMITSKISNTSSLGLEYFIDWVPRFLSPAALQKADKIRDKEPYEDKKVKAKLAKPKINRTYL